MTDCNPVAVLFQAIEPPVIDSIRKPKKPTGYADSGADIAFVLQQRGHRVVTPVSAPDPAVDTDWVFPDSADGIEAAIVAGAGTVWANTILFEGHPLEQYVDSVKVVGQLPSMVHEFDDKWHTNQLLRDKGLPVADALLLAARGEGSEVLGIAEIDARKLAELGYEFPLVLKPLRGRGSQGVVVVEDLAELFETAHELFERTTTIDGAEYSVFGSRLILEKFLPGREITVTVMPATESVAHWSMPLVERDGHDDGIAPYNGVVPVSHNSRLLTATSSALDAISDACAEVGDLLGARAPIRIDCREGGDGVYRMFDVNMKPNMTGAGRPGREAEDSLSCIAARGLDWSYGDLLEAMLDSAWGGAR